MAGSRDPCCSLLPLTVLSVGPLGHASSIWFADARSHKPCRQLIVTCDSNERRVRDPSRPSSDSQPPSYFVRISPLPARLIQQQTPRHRRIQTLHGPGQGIVTCASAISIHSAANPAPSFPIITAQAPLKSISCAATTRALRTHSRNQPHSPRLQPSISDAATATTGTRNTLPTLARSAFWFHALTVPGVVNTPVAPNASADRTSVPRFPGSCNPAAIKINAAVPHVPTPHSNSQTGGTTNAAIPCGDCVSTALRNTSSVSRTTSTPSRHDLWHFAPLTHKHRLQHHPTAQRLFQQVLPLNRRQSATQPNLPGKRRPQLLHPRIRSARNHISAHPEILPLSSFPPVIYSLGVTSNRMIHGIKTKSLYR